MPETLRITKPKLLIGEGKDEENFFNALLKHMHTNDIQVLSSGGKDKNKFRAWMAAVVASSGFANTVTSIGITRDADFAGNGTKGAFDSICSSLKQPHVDLPVPSALNQTATAESKPAVHIFIRPDNQSEGMLENLLLRTLNADKELGCVQDYFDCLKTKAFKEHPSHMQPKGLVYAWLAGQNPPDHDIGTSALDGIWNFDHPAFDALKAFIQAL